MHYVIVGNGVAGATAAFTLRERDSKAKITLISGETDYFFSRTALMYAYMDRMTPRDLEPHERKAYDVKRVDRVRGWVRDLDAGRKELTLEGGQKISYDRLLLATGSVPNRFPWTGLDRVKDGAVHFVSMQHLEECERLTPTTREAVVVGGGLIGVELVECLVHHGVKVTFLVREKWYWPIALAAEEGQMISDHIRHNKVDLRLEEEVAEVVTDASGRVSLIKTNRGNELPAQMLGIAVGVRPAIDWLKNVATPLALGRGIKVNPDFETSLPGVFSAGDCAEIVSPGAETGLVEQIWYSAKRQGELAARAMLGDHIAYEPPLFYNSAKFFEIEYTTVGRATKLPESAISFHHRVPGKDVSLRVIENDGAVIGFNMLGSRWNHRVFEKWVHERRSMDEVMAMLEQAQFDVEFGRLDLRSARQAYEAWRRQAA